MDRASDSGSEGWGFESLLAYQKQDVPCGMSCFCLREGTRTIKCGSPVDCRQIPAGRNLLHNVPSPFWRTPPDGLFFGTSVGTRKGGGSAAAVKRVRWTLFSPWESPFPFRRIPLGMWMKGKPPAVQPGYSGGLPPNAGWTAFAPYCARRGRPRSAYTLF